MSRRRDNARLASAERDKIAVLNREIERRQARCFVGWTDHSCAIPVAQGCRAARMVRVMVREQDKVEPPAVGFDRSADGRCVSRIDHGDLAGLIVP
ncbi:hypothetical protein ANI02nite_02820 [Acetobacter nitrogenifigens DSM 23921 = NBRC 105050]|uniref:Uncharacterized protein n=1 Tax=Acetobacter nitrogenifigens DSM 23921 = NBRC 105050 TaxID=1120919 RepID=A0A511X624_9PROT|nr:hypothetical protein ANI02nite_02820 [Acetobacter nitrogenifigens DSM 23921 = NBRC 105050]